MYSPNLYSACFNLVKQIPSGRVSTYKAVAEALGDTIAAKAVCDMLSDISECVKEDVPFH
ncbi:MAG: MGMT family protein, partial [Thermoplasmata archaeon]